MNRIKTVYRIIDTDEGMFAVEKGSFMESCLLCHGDHIIITEMAVTINYSYCPKQMSLKYSVIEEHAPIAVAQAVLAEYKTAILPDSNKPGQRRGKPCFLSRGEMNRLDYSTQLTIKNDLEINL